MASHLCEREPEVLVAAAAGRVQDAGLKAHLDTCVSCRDAVQTVEWIQRMAAAPVESHQLPDPSVIWWKAQLLRRWEAERRAAAPIERMHWVELTAGLGSLAVFVVWQWAGLMSAMGRLNPAALLAPAMAPAAAPSAASMGAASPLAFMLMFGGILAVGAMVFASIHRRITQG